MNIVIIITLVLVLLNLMLTTAALLSVLGLSNFLYKMFVKKKSLPQDDLPENGLVDLAESVDERTGWEKPFPSYADQVAFPQLEKKN